MNELPDTWSLKEFVAVAHVTKGRRVMRDAKRCAWKAHSMPRYSLSRHTRTQEDTADLVMLGLEVELHAITHACQICPVVGASS
jgi:hypothetical protein